MSRWKQSLCGSVIINPEAEATELEAVYGNMSQVLSCGGHFLPHKREDALKGGLNKAVMNLAKEDYEVLVYDQSDEWLRYGGELDPYTDELEISEEATFYFEEEK